VKVEVQLLIYEWGESVFVNNQMKVISMYESDHIAAWVLDLHTTWFKHFTVHNT